MLNMYDFVTIVSASGLNLDCLGGKSLSSTLYQSVVFLHFTLRVKLDFFHMRGKGNLITDCFY